jgi:uncharacterized FlaG/YvyC family protein
MISKVQSAGFPVVPAIQVANLMGKKAQSAPLHGEDLNAEQKNQTYRQVEAIMDQVAKRQKVRCSISIELNREINRVIVSIRDSDTDEKIFQFPPEEFVEFAKRFQQYLGLMVDRRV